MALVLACGLLAILALLAVRRVFLGYPRPTHRTECLSGAEMAFVEAASDAFFPAGGPVPPSGREAGLPDYVDHYTATVPPALRRLIRMLFFLFEHATLVFGASGPGGRRRFSSLTSDQQSEVIDSWRESRLYPRQIAFMSLRSILTLGYLAHPPVLRTLGLAPLEVPTPVCEADLLYPPIGAPPSAIAFEESDLTPPSDGTPIDPHGPLHPDYRDERR